MKSDHKMEGRVAYLLKTPIQTAVGGQMEDVQVIDLVAPSKKQLKKTYRLQQYITQAMLSSQKAFKGVSEGAGTDVLLPEEKAEPEAAMDAQTVMAMLLASDVDMEACFSEFEKLAALGCVEVNGLPINKIQYENIEFEDLQGAFANYIATFTLPSVMKTFSNS